MKLTKYGHACVRIEKNGKVLVIDPGVFTDASALDGADVVLVTHDHFDHADRDKLAALAPEVSIWTCEGVASGSAEGLDAHVVRHGDAFEAAGFEMKVFGEWHAANHPDLPVVDNVGFLVDGEVFYPGDAFTVPPVPVGTLLVPTGAPWLKLAEVIEYLRTVKPARAYSTHDALYSEAGLGLVDNWLRMEAEKQGADIRRLAVGDSATLS
ncbi:MULTISPECIES: MBL fold metallo-hydrolase [unclassified Nonomuraea]|uniref:MBL fold metallo-hydrolase n=1 Tax=Nonomuraea sp. NPDC003804 TaxID=3154547 RepID=UPI0033B6DF38